VKVVKPVIMEMVNMVETTQLFRCMDPQTSPSIRTVVVLGVHVVDPIGQ
jgi:hypothetical protein